MSANVTQTLLRPALQIPTHQVAPIPLVSLAPTLYHSSSCTMFYSDACLLLYSASPVTNHLQFITTNQVMVHYQALDPSDTAGRLFRAYNDTSPL